MNGHAAPEGPAAAAARVAHAIAALETAIPHLRRNLSGLFGMSGLTGAPAPTVTADTSGSRPHRVLVCENDDATSLGLTILFGVDARFEVVAAVSDAESAIEQAGRERPDVVLLDLAMPGIGGLAAIRHVREQAPPCRIIVLCGIEEPQAAEQALREGAAGVIFKREDAHGLLDEVSAIMGTSRRVPSSASASVVDLQAWVASRAAEMA